MVQYCVLYLFCCNVRPVSPRIRSSVLTASLRQNADGACLIITRTRRRALFVSDSLSRQYPSLLTRTPARAHSQAEKHHFALSPPRGQGSGRQYTPQKNARTQSNMTTAESIARCHRIYVGACATGTCLFFVFWAADCVLFCVLFAYATGGERYLRREYPPRDKCTKAKRGGYTLFYPGHNDIHTKHDSDNAAKNSGRSQPPSGKGLSEYLLQSAKGAGSRTLFPCKLPTRRKITPRPLPCYNTDTEDRRTYKTFDRKTAAPVSRTDEP